MFVSYVICHILIVKMKYITIHLVKQSLTISTNNQRLALYLLPIVSEENENTNLISNTLYLIIHFICRERKVERNVGSLRNIKTGARVKFSNLIRHPMALKLHLHVDAQLSPVERGIKIEINRVGAYFC